MKKLWLHFTYIAGWCLSDMSGLLTGGLVEWLCPFHSKDLTTKLRQSHYVITYKVYTYVYNIFDIYVYVSAKWLLLILENSKGVGTSLCPTCISAYHPKIKVVTKCVVNCGKFLYVLLEHFSKTLFVSVFIYRIALNYGPGIYFFPAIFNLVTKWDRWLLLEEKRAIYNLWC